MKDRMSYDHCKRDVSRSKDTCKCDRNKSMSNFKDKCAEKHRDTKNDTGKYQAKMF